MIWALVIEQEILGSYPDSDMDVYNGTDFTLNGGPGLFRPCGPKMTVAPITNQPTNQLRNTLKYVPSSYKKSCPSTCFFKSQNLHFHTVPGFYAKHFRYALTSKE